jgi:O-antigen/teichoic acid export membrane protein
MAPATHRALLGSYLAQGYVAGVGIALLPAYLAAMGATGFGLVGLYLTLQAAVQLFDLGISPTLSREMARYRAAAISVDAAAQRVAALERVLGTLVVVVALALVLARHAIARHWLHGSALEPAQLAHCILAIAVAATLRWLASFYRQALIGLERHAQVNALSSTFATLRFVAVLAWWPWLRDWPVLFFVHQAGVGLLEVAIYRKLVLRPLGGSAALRADCWRGLRPLVPVAASMALIGGLWIALTQFDRVLLSRWMDLRDYGIFSLAVTAAGGINLLIPPLAQVLQPRLAVLVSAGDRAQLIAVYRLASQAVAAVFAAVGATLALMPHQVIYAWSGNAAVTIQAAPMLSLYAAAYALVAVGSLPFYLQFAYGRLRLHLLNNLVATAVLLPAYWFTARHWGAIGTGATFCIVNAVSLLSWVPWVQSRFLGAEAKRWLLPDVLLPGLVAVAAVGLAARVLPYSTSRIADVVEVLAALGVALPLGALAGGRSRAVLCNLIRGRT